MGIRIYLFPATLLGGTLLVATASTAQEVTEGVAAASFMVGCWAEPAPEGNGLREVFAPPAANMLTGLSQFWVDGRIVDFEFHRIDASLRGPVLTPHPSGVASVAFHPVETAPDRIVWQNLKHDFPQRIIYHRVAVDTLAVRVEGGVGEAARGMDWRMARVACTP